MLSRRAVAFRPFASLSNTTSRSSNSSNNIILSCSSSSSSASLFTASVSSSSSSSFSPSRYSLSSSSSSSSSQQQPSSFFFSSTIPTSFNQFASCSSAAPSSEVSPEIADVANCFRTASSNRIPLGRVIHGVTPVTKSKIFKTGKGLEGYLRQFPSIFAIEKVGNDKFLLLLDERLKDECEGKVPHATSTIAPPLSTAQKRRKEQEEAKAKQQQQQQQQQQTNTTVVQGKANLQPYQKDSSSSASSSKEKTTSNMFVDEMQSQEKTAREEIEKRKTEAAEKQQQQEASSSSTEKAGNEEQQEGEKAKAAPDAGDENPELTQRVKACCPGENQWYRILNIHEALYKGTSVQLGPFVQFLLRAPKHFWVDPSAAFVCRRLAYHTQPPPNLTLRARSGKLASGSQQAQQQHEWGEARNAPTSQDVFEILRFIPIHWTEFGTIQIPDGVRKKHIRIASKLTWFARQPKFFDLRWIGGTCEVRRAPVLHPQEHGMTKEEAEKLVQARLEEDAKYGQPLVLMQARGINVASPSSSATSAGSASSSSATAGGSSSSSSSPVASSDSSSPAGATAKPVATTTPAGATTTQSTSASSGSTSSSIVDAVTKALVRIAPGYLVTAESIMRRATKKMSDDDLIIAANKLPLIVERVVVQSKVDPSVSISLYRRKIGVDESTWKPEFIRELEESPNLRLLGALMTHTCAQWDRTHFLYVRLPDSDKIASGGFDEMVEFLRKHPQTFRVGEFFVKRNDLSDPTNAEADAEPTSKIVTTTKQLEDNPYHQLIDLATVFHYLTPDSDSVSLSHYVDSSSPAMRSVLPPRILTILQAYPDKFTCREIAPGTFAVAKAKTSSSSSGGGSGAGAGGGDEEDGGGGEPTMTREEIVDKLVALVPPRGVDISHLEATMPQQLRRAIVKEFGAGGVAALVQQEAQSRFHVVRNPPYTTLFVRHSK